MKKTKNTNFKKLALLGITGGAALCASPLAADVQSINTSQLLAANCGGKSGCSSLTAYQSHGCSAQPQNDYQAYPQGAYQQSGCSSARPNSGCNSARPNGGYTAYQPHGCSAAQPQSYYSTDAMPDQSSNPNGYNAMPQSGCSAAPMPQSGAMPQQGQGNGVKGAGQPQAYRSMSQWETGGRIATADTQTGKSTDEAKALSQLNEEGKSLYKGLDPAGKEMANRALAQMSGKTPEERTQAIRAIAQKLSEQRAKSNAPKY